MRNALESFMHVQDEHGAELFDLSAFQSIADEVMRRDSEMYNLPYDPKVWGIDVEDNAENMMDYNHETTILSDKLFWLMKALVMFGYHVLKRQQEWSGWSLRDDMGYITVYDTEEECRNEWENQIEYNERCGVDWNFFKYIIMMHGDEIVDQYWF